LISQNSFPFGLYGVVLVSILTRMASSALFQEFVIVVLVVVLHDFGPDFGGVNPRDEIFHVPCDKERRIRHHRRSHSHVSLFDERACFFQRFRHFHPHHDDAEPSPAEGGGGQFFQPHEASFRLYESHVVQFLQECLGELDPRGIVRFHLGERVHEFGHHPGDFVVRGVIFPVLYVVSAQHLQFSVLVLSLPLQEVHLFQQFPFVFFQLPHVVSRLTHLLPAGEACVPIERVLVRVCVRLYGSSPRSSTCGDRLGRVRRRIDPPHRRGTYTIHPSG